MKVRVLKVGEGTQELTVGSGCTVEGALGASGIGIDGCKITVNGTVAEFGCSLREGDVIAVTPKVEGGSR